MFFYFSFFLLKVICGHIKMAKKKKKDFTEWVIVHDVQLRVLKEVLQGKGDRALSLYFNSFYLVDLIFCFYNYQVELSTNLYFKQIVNKKKKHLYHMSILFGVTRCEIYL